MDDERRPDGAPASEPSEPEAALPDAPQEATAGPATPDDPLPADQVPTEAQPDDQSPPDAPAASVPPPLVQWNAPATPTSGWEAAVAAASTSRIDVGSLFGRTLDTFLTGWRTFVVLGIPLAVLGALSQFVVYDYRTLSNPWITVALALVAIPVYLAVVLAMIVAADDLRAGRPTSIGPALRRGISRTGVAIVSGILFALVYFCVALLVFIPGGIVIALVGAALGRDTGVAVAGVLLAVLVIAGFAVIFYVLLRLSMFIAPIALDRAGPVEGLRISWRVVKGHLWRLGILFVAVYLLIFPLTVGASLLAFATNPLIGGVIAVVAFLVTTPLLAIALSLAYGDLTGRPRSEPHVRSPGRTPYAVAVLVIGVVLFVPSVALAIPRLGELAVAAIPPEDRGRLYFGTERNPLNPCAPLGRSTTFLTTDSIYIGGYFSQALLPGQSASIHVYVDDNEAINTPIQAGAQAVSCYYEPSPLVGAPAAEYRIVIEDGTTLYAEGTFTVQ